MDDGSLADWSFNESASILRWGRVVQFGADFEWLGVIWLIEVLGRMARLLMSGQCLDLLLWSCHIEAAEELATFCETFAERHRDRLNPIHRVPDRHCWDLGEGDDDISPVTLL